MSITSDEVNFLIYRYLQENGFSHSAFTFAYESLVAKSSIAHVDLPPGALITFLQKGLEYVAIEEHISQDGTVKEYDGNFSLLSPIICDTIATREEKKIRRTNVSCNAPITTNNNSNGHENGESSSVIVGDSLDAVPSAVIPSTINLKNDTETHAKWLQLLGHQGEVFMCVWNPVQRQLASGSSDSMCRLWGLWEMDKDQWNFKDCEVHLPTSIMQHSQYPGERFKDVTSVTWSPDGQFLATGCYDGMARIWDNTGCIRTMLKEHSGPVFSLKWNKQGNYILSGSYDRRAIVWDSETGAVVKIFSVHDAPILDVDWKNGDTFATCSSDMLIKVCQVGSSNGEALRTFEGHTDEVNAVSWSPGGLYLASCSDDSTAKIWSVDSGLLHTLSGHLKEIYTIRWTPTGAGSNNPDKPLLLCTASFDGTVKVWSAQSGLLVHSLRRHEQPVYSIAPSPDGEFLATGSLGGHLVIWTLSDASLVREFVGPGDTFDVSWSHDGGMLCSCYSSGALHVLDTTHIKQLAANNGAAVASSARRQVEEDDDDEDEEQEVEQELGHEEAAADSHSHTVMRVVSDCKEESIKLEQEEQAVSRDDAAADEMMETRDDDHDHGGQCEPAGTVAQTETGAGVEVKSVAVADVVEHEDSVSMTIADDLDTSDMSSIKEEQEESKHPVDQAKVATATVPSSSLSSSSSSSSASIDVGISITPADNVLAFASSAPES